MGPTYFDNDSLLTQIPYCNLLSYFSFTLFYFRRPKHVLYFGFSFIVKCTGLVVSPNLVLAGVLCCHGD